jgi:invasion protein IalB
MFVWIVSAPRRWGAPVFAPTACAIVLMTAVLATTAGSSAWAQAPAQPAAPKAQPKAQPKAAPQAAPPAQAAAPEVPPLMYSPWTKVCPPKGQDPNAHQVCFTGKEGRLPDNGFMVIGALLIEQEGSTAKVLRITVPLGMLVQPGTRVIIDQGQPMTAPYAMCFPTGCVAEYEASQELIGKFKKGQSMVVQAINGDGSPISLAVPLPDFAKAYDGPPTDPKVIEERQKKLQEEILKKQQLQQQAAPAAPK